MTSKIWNQYFCAHTRTHHMANFDAFEPPIFFKEMSHYIFDTFINLDQHQTCGKIWLQSSKQPLTLGGVKRLRG